MASGAHQVEASPKKTKRARQRAAKAKVHAAEAAAAAETPLPAPKPAPKRDEKDYPCRDFFRTGQCSFSPCKFSHGT